ncbi:hypothetical protein ABT297_40340 [Dactylosporangium sp. NPDC000555]|uniref:hypothetical protein n=1 Tax=Dactylosporangium sp. NPDC000555 TaxID=3154260 RepID=UPI0033347FEA
MLELANFRAEMIDLSAHFNNTAATTRDTTGDGALNVWRNSFPVEELPGGADVFRPGAVPFRFPRTGPGQLDNVVCAGQRIDLRPARYDWIYLLACAERRVEDVVHLHYRDGAVDEEWLRVSDFWPASPPHFGELEAVRCERIHFPRHVQPGIGPRIWQQRLPVPRQEELGYLRLPDNVAVHIFAMTAVSNGWQ